MIRRAGWRSGVGCAGMDGRWGCAYDASTKMAERRGWFGAEVVWVLVCGWALRGAYLLLKPAGASALDAKYWEDVAGVLGAGGNPYVSTARLNYAPFWMQCIWGMSRLAEWMGVSFASVLWGALIAAESAVVVLMFRLMWEVGRSSEVREDPLGGAEVGNGAGDARCRRRVMLWGVALNPAMVFQVCQHGNFDVMMAAWVVLFLTGVVRFGRSGDGVDWLGACLWLGLGVLTKTVPLALVPLLAVGARGLGWKVIRLGGGLVVGPAALAMSVAYVLAPEAVWGNVVRYRSLPGWYGVTGLLHLAGAGRAGLERYGAVFSWVLVAWLIGGTWWLWGSSRHGGPPSGRPSGRWVVLLAGVVMLALPTLGPGYGPQYVWWYWPGVLVGYAAYEARWWRRLLLAAGAVLVVTYVSEYLTGSGMGGWMDEAWGRRWEGMRGQTLMRLPLFLASLAVLVSGVVMLRREANAAGDGAIPNAAGTSGR